MSVRTPIVLALIASVAAAAPGAALAGCTTQSGAATTALVELYTSEGCSSCPPADQQLRRLRETVGPTAAVVPLALHVDYWDYIGWKDPFSKAAFGKRQTWLVEANHAAVVYTPHFFVSGTEVGSWTKQLADEVRMRNAKRPRADIALQASVGGGGALVVDVQTTLRAGNEPAALYLAVTESGLQTKVTRGENAGATLLHDHVVREWVGPLPIGDGTTRTRREIALPATWNAARLDVVGFVEGQSTGEVLQAVSAMSCAKS